MIVAEPAQASGVINASFCARVCSTSPWQRMTGPPNHMPPNAGDLPLRGRDLGLILVDRLCTIAQMNVQIERGILRGRRVGQEQQQSCQGGLVGRSATAARQLASRARRRVHGAAVPAPDPDLARQRHVVDAFFAAAHRGDFDALVAVLDPDVVLRSDGWEQRRALRSFAKERPKWRILQSRLRSPPQSKLLRSSMAPRELSS
jgi:hypothetical protein